MPKDKKKKILIEEPVEIKEEPPPKTQVKTQIYY